MRDLLESAEPAYFSRMELELHLARLALAVIRSAPEAFDGLRASESATSEDSPAELAEQLLRRAHPDHRAFAEARLGELARCLAGAPGGDVHGLLAVSISTHVKPTPATPGMAQPLPLR